MRSPVDVATQHCSVHGHAILAEFRDFLALPNVSRDLDDVRVNADHIVAMLSSRGVEVRTEEIAGAAPVVIGGIDVGAARTVGIYVHYDGQPVQPAEWRFGPFTPTLVDGAGVPRPWPGPGDPVDDDWRLYARAAADDKAPIAALAAALDAVTPAVNVKLLFEGEEEIGSPHLPAYLAGHRDELGADVWFICDGPVHTSGRPQVAFGVRGMTELELTVYGPTRSLHSGHYGNWAPNPALALARLLASMKAADGEVLIAGFEDDTVPVTDNDLAAIAALPDDDERLRRELGLAATESGGAALPLTLMRPSLNVRGLAAGGVGAQAANVVPAAASASIDIRLALGDDPDKMLDRVADHVRAAGYHLVDGEPDQETRMAHARIARIRRTPGYPAVRTPIGTDAGRWVLGAAAEAAGEPVVALPTFGGSVPLHGFVTELGAPVVITPFANHDNNQHAANENLRLGNLWYGVRLMAALLTHTP